MREKQIRKSEFRNSRQIQLLSRAVKNYTLNLGRFICRALMNNTSSLVSWTDLHDFNTRLELLFFEVLNTSQICLITSAFCQKISQFYMTYVLTSSTYVLTHPLYGCPKNIKKIFQLNIWIIYKFEQQGKFTKQFTYSDN